MVQEPSEQLLVKARQVICLVEEAVATVGADTGTVPQAIERIAARHDLTTDEARAVLVQHAARYGHRVEAVASAVVRFDLDVDADLGS